MLTISCNGYLLQHRSNVGSAYPRYRLHWPAPTVAGVNAEGALANRTQLRALHWYLFITRSSLLLSTHAVQRLLLVSVVVPQLSFARKMVRAPVSAFNITRRYLTARRPCSKVLDGSTEAHPTQHHVYLNRRLRTQGFYRRVTVLRSLRRAVIPCSVIHSENAHGASALPGTWHHRMCHSTAGSHHTVHAIDHAHWHIYLSRNAPAYTKL